MYSDRPCCRFSRLMPCSRNQQLTTNPASGIAQLRRASDQAQQYESPDNMDIDDFIEPNSTTSPANLTPSPPTPLPNTISSAIPIKNRKESHELGIHPGFPPSAPIQERARSREFDYVQRRVRKTSIDETKAGSAIQGYLRLSR